jgi:hypothetical protein
VAKKREVQYEETQYYSSMGKKVGKRKEKRRQFEMMSRAAGKCPKGFHVSKIKISTMASQPKDAPEGRVISACVDENEEWAVHQRRGGRKSAWNVTHVRSGLAATTGRNRKHAFCVARKLGSETIAGAVSGPDAVNAMYESFGGREKFLKDVDEAMKDMSFPHKPTHPAMLIEKECEMGKQLMKRTKKAGKGAKVFAKKLASAIEALDACAARCKAIPKKFNGETKPRCAGACTKAFLREVHKILRGKGKR